MSCVERRRAATRLGVGLSPICFFARALVAVVFTASIVLATGCTGKVFYLPSHSKAGDYPGSRAEGGFPLEGPEPPLRLLWQQEVDSYPLGKSLLAGPLLLQLTMSPKLYAFDRYNGRRLGRMGVPEGVCAAPRLVGSAATLLILAEARGGDKPILRAMNRQTRKTEWTFAGAVCAPVATRNDTVIVPLETGALVALAAADGSQLWRVETEAGLVAGPSLSGGTVFAGDLEGNLVAVSLRDGSEIWSAQLGASVRSQPLVAGGRVFANTGSGVTQAFDALTGEALWQQPLGALLTPGFALADSVVIVGSSDRVLYALDLEEGTIVWRFETKGSIRGVPASTAETVYAGSSDGFVYAIDVKTGLLKWKYRLDGPVTQPVTLGLRGMSVTTDAGTVYFFGKE